MLFQSWPPLIAPENTGMTAERVAEKLTVMT